MKDNNTHRKRTGDNFLVSSSVSSTDSYKQIKLKIKCVNQIWEKGVLIIVLLLFLHLFKDCVPHIFKTVPIH
jgi:hypothetical protein